MLPSIGNLISQTVTLDQTTLNVLVGIAIVLGFAGTVWTISRKTANTDNTISNISHKLTELEKDFTKTIAELKAEVKIELSDKTSGIQRQIDSMKSDLKDVSNRVTIVNTKIEQHDKLIDYVGIRMDKLVDFFRDWNQRIEDRIDTAKRDIMGFMNMLISMNNRNKNARSG